MATLKMAGGQGKGLGVKEQKQGQNNPHTEMLTVG